MRCLHARMSSARSACPPPPLPSPLPQNPQRRMMIVYAFVLNCIIAACLAIFIGIPFISDSFLHLCITVVSSCKTPQFIQGQRFTKASEWCSSPSSSSINIQPHSSSSGPASLTPSPSHPPPHTLPLTPSSSHPPPHTLRLSPSSSHPLGTPQTSRLTSPTSSPTSVTASASSAA
jgi:hypothetical protein